MGDASQRQRRAVRYRTRAAQRARFVGRCVETVAHTGVGSEVVVSQVADMVADTGVGSEIVVRTDGCGGSVADTVVSSEVVGSEIFVRTGGYVGSVADTVVGQYGAIF
jgi:hypothetical protein